MHKGEDENYLSSTVRDKNPTEDLSRYYTCRSCGMKFDSFGDMQRHILVDHMQKGDIP